MAHLLGASFGRMNGTISIFLDRYWAQDHAGMDVGFQNRYCPVVVLPGSGLSVFFRFFLVFSGFFPFLVLKTTLKSTKPLLEPDRTSSGTQHPSQNDPGLKMDPKSKKYPILWILRWFLAPKREKTRKNRKKNGQTGSGKYYNRTVPVLEPNVHPSMILGSISIQKDKYIQFCGF